jgi:PAS domain S-box-containing protein
MSEIRAPFIKAGLITTAFSILLIILGSIVFRRVGNPLIKHLEESEERYRKVVEQSPDAILVHANGSIIFANSTTIKMIGVDCQETIIGKNISEFFPNLSWKEEEKRVEDKNFSGLSATVKEEQLLKPDGTAIEVEISSIPFEFKGREGIQTVIHDISERKRAENTMNIVAEGVSRAKTGKEFFKSLVESIGTSLDVAYAFVGELEGNDINTIAVWGDGKVQPNFRYNLEHTPCQVASETNICAYPWDIQKYFPKDRMLIEMSIESYAGARLIDSAGRPIGIIVILDRKPLNNLNMAINMLEIFGTRAAAEIERKKNEESLEKAKEEAEVATLQKDKYIALVTHDLRSPLLTMLGYLGVIKRDSKITKKESTKKAIVQSKKIAGEMLVLIDDILDIGRFKSGTMGINKKFFSAYFISEKVIENHKNLAEEKSVRIVNDVERSSRLYADPALFIEVIKNLVVNAI